MNRRHFLAFLWLRWRLRVNQFKRAGTANLVISMIFVAAMIPGAIVVFIGAFAAGAFGLPLLAEHQHDELPVILLLIWDGLALLFLFAWSIGILAELQRSEALSIDKFLHLPVSLSGVFVINYLSSLASLNLLLFVPIMVGFILGAAVGLGPSMLLMLPLLAAFLLAVTGPTYQFQGWLGTLMANPRRRRTVIVVVTMVFVLVSQAPQLVNLLQPWRRTTDVHNEENAAQMQLGQELADQKITLDEYNRRTAEVRKDYQQKREDYDRGMWAEVKWWAVVANMVVPPGWLALGASGLQQGDVWPALAGTLGFTLIGVVSLWRAYRTTLAYYTGQFSSGARKAVVPAAPAIERKVRPANAFLERRLPGVSERASAIAFGSFRALMRAPEVKMILLAPLFIVVFFGVMIAQGGTPPEMVRPLIPFGAMVMTLLSMTQLIGNQFGFDRSGFRVFVLCPAPRRDILIGKNLAAAPIALGLAAVLTTAIELIFPMRIDVFLAVLVQLVSMYVLYCMVANVLSILAPMPIAAGSMKAVNWKIVPILIHMSAVMAYPFIIGPVLVPIGIQILVDELWQLPNVPIALVLAIGECAVLVLLYRVVVTWEGNLLQRREQQILEVVTTKAE